MVLGPILTKLPYFDRNSGYHRCASPRHTRYVRYASVSLQKNGPGIFEMPGL